MTLKKVWNRFIEKYMRNTAESITAADFPVDEVKRYRIIFSGMVQGVGFRYETWAIAQKLELSGFVENCSNGTVYAEIQGPKNRIICLIDCLKSIPRIQITDVDIEELALKKEQGFEITN